MNNVMIKSYQESYRSQIVDVWERSVRATHHFLSIEDFEEIKKLVQGIDFAAFEVYCLMNEDTVIGFIGVAERKVEMLFLDPAYFSGGLGKRLLMFAMSDLRACEVDVNEQNTNAVKFYERMGFKVYERTDKDDQGRAYPLLRMRL
ncbi:GNAT family N-acetyltransferase [Pseudochryseolinea flava]|uniref:GNAT family N-acetyltransferase n=1 Tax=Pseudochryseolinea flava TaxID=2059302 RepID=A0A364Y106_9BACT|nr:GNAT family N-acetyltransferase [Pseudochryseolinea flava]RAW00503.1 GNAT family N-acetyltransferase [Pseudochryseolinea flava]